MTPPIGSTRGGVRGLPIDTSPVIVDDYEDGDIAEYAGDTGSYTTQQTTVYEGSYALQETDTSTGAAWLQSTSGLNAYPSQGDTWSVRVYLDQSTSNPFIQYALQSNTNGSDRYDLQLDSQNGDFKIRVTSGGSTSTLASDTSVSYPSGEWLKVTVQWASDGTMTATVEDASGTQLSQISATDTTFTSGGVGFIDPSDEQPLFDYWVIE